MPEFVLRPRDKGRESTTLDGADNSKTRPFNAAKDR